MAQRKETAARARAAKPPVDMLEDYSPFKPGRILRTSTKPKENAFESLRPKKGDCLEYNISETLMRLDAGDTKINVRDTNVDYVPMPPAMLEAQQRRSAKSKLGSGCPPQWKFLDEIWLAKQEALQEVYRQELEMFKKERKKMDQLKGRGMHRLIQSMVGPDWYQELSPNQLRTVDQLEWCILRDTKFGTYVNSQENIGALGLVLRPNHNHIQRALRLCCKSPVEFLLILYQLINPNRQSYSLNDRLLLSAVVHLTMTLTLREMHIRMPSPPGRKKIAAKVPKKEKPKKYDSPYLKPYTFEPEPQKYTGIYVNKHVQYPESRYFAYIPALKLEREWMDDIFEMDFSSLDPDEAVIMEELKQAQAAYDDLQKDAKVKLLKPSIIKLCPDAEDYYNVATVTGRGPRRATGDVDTGVSGSIAGAGTRVSSVSRSRAGSIRGTRAGSIFGGTCAGSIPGDGREDDLQLPSLAELEDSDEECECDQMSDDSGDIICCNPKSHGIAITCDCHRKCKCEGKSKKFLRKCKKCMKEEHRGYLQRVITGVKITSSNSVVPIIDSTRLQKPCECLKTYEYKIIAAKARDKLQARKAKYTIAGVVITSNGPVYNLTAVLSKKKRRDVDFTGEMEICAGCKRERPVSRIDDPQCACGRPIKGGSGYQALPCNCKGRCTCEEKSKNSKPKCRKCAEEEQQTFIEKAMSGMVDGPCKHDSKCDCLQKYIEKIMALNARNRIKERKATFVIGGVTITPDGPVYTVSTALRNKHRAGGKNRAGDICRPICDCTEKLIAAKARRKIKNENATFVIAGVALTPKGPVYIMSTAYKRCKKQSNVTGGVCKPHETNEAPRAICDCEANLIAAKARRKIMNENATFAIGGVASTPTGPVYIISTVYEGCKKQRNVTREVCEKPPKMPYPFCKCLEKLARQARHYIMAQQAHFVVAGVTMTPNGPIYILSTAIKRCKRRSIVNSREIFTMIPEKARVRKCTCGANIEPYCEHEFSQPCDCKGVCRCRELAKIYTERCQSCADRELREYNENIISGMRQTGSNRILPIIGGIRPPKTCDCLEKYAENIRGIEARNMIKCLKSKFVISGVACTPNGPVYILSTVVWIDLGVKAKGSVEVITLAKKAVEDCRCMEKEDSGDEGEVKYGDCSCKDELDRFLYRQCRCDACNEEERRRNALHVMSGVKFTASGGVVSIIEGTREQQCDCLENYREKIESLEDYRKRIEARYNLRSQNLKFAIGGVVTTADGPVYVISGLRPPVECDCATAAREREEEAEHLRTMARMPNTGRIKYQISGVKQTPEGNVYVLSHALPIEDCDCVKLYNTFAEAHRACLDSFRQFLEKTQQSLEEYMAEAEQLYKQDDTEEQEDNVGDGEENDLDGYADECDDRAREIVPVKRCMCQDDFDDSESEESESSSEEEPDAECNGTREDADKNYPSTGVGGEAARKSAAAAGSSLVPAARGRSSSIPAAAAASPSVPRSDREGDLERSCEATRFFIMSKIPCNERKQVEILMKVLKTLAEDGFALAKLPDCHKLPHFKLWMQLRCGKFWMQKDRLPYDAFTKTAYCHTDMCRRKIPSPQLGISKRKANQMTWGDAAFIRQVVSDKLGMFYRLVSQQSVDVAREMFPLMFDYEFPTCTFRDCYFAYLPCKEQDVLAFRIVKPHEARTNLKKYPCYC